jgi:hypothetical protein
MLSVDKLKWKSWTPFLAAAALNRRAEALTILKKTGANAQAKDLHGRNRHILGISLNPNLEVAKTLVNGGVSPNELDKQGRTALNYALETRPEMAPFLTRG